MAKGSLEILKNKIDVSKVLEQLNACLLYTSPSPRDCS